MREALLRILEEAGRPGRALDFSDGSRLLVLPHGARVLGLFGPATDESFFWTSEALGSSESARRLFRGETWQNTGGDRTWLAPELDLFFPEYPSLRTYLQPRALDPGTWVARDIPGGLALSTGFAARLFRTGCQVALEVRKEIGAAPNPLRHEGSPASPRDLEYAGYTLRTVVGFAEPPPRGARVGAWSLLQLPHGGDLIVPTYGRTEPHVWFGAVSGDDLVVTERLVLWRMRAEGEHKIGVRAVATTGRAGYIRRAADGRWSLVVRNFHVNPSGEYVDVAANDPDRVGCSVQACNVHSGLGRFSELEHHAPAAGDGLPPRSHDISEVWAFRGSEEAVRSAASVLLGPLP